MNDRGDLPALYRDLFEIDKRGAAILDDLIARFGHAKVHTDGGIDAVLKTYRAAARREVLDYIATRINQANGVNDPQPPEGDPEP